MEEKRMLGEKSQRLLQCYCMFYGEVPTYKTQEKYREIYEDIQLMMNFLDSFGYSLIYTSKDQPLKRWYCPNRYLSKYFTAPELDAPIYMLNRELEGKTKEEIEDYYQERLRRNPFYDEEITSRIGLLIEHYAKTNSESKKTVLRDLTIPQNFKITLQNEKEENLEEVMKYAKTIFYPVVDLTKEYAINDPRYLEFVKKYLKIPEKEKQKILIK